MALALIKYLYLYAEGRSDVNEPAAAGLDHGIDESGANLVT